MCIFVLTSLSHTLCYTIFVNKLNTDILWALVMTAHIQLKRQPKRTIVSRAYITFSYRHGWSVNSLKATAACVITCGSIRCVTHYDCMHCLRLFFFLFFSELKPWVLIRVTTSIFKQQTILLVHLVSIKQHILKYREEKNSWIFKFSNFIQFFSLSTKHIQFYD